MKKPITISLVRAMNWAARRAQSNPRLRNYILFLLDRSGLGSSILAVVESSIEKPANKSSKDVPKSRLTREFWDHRKSLRIRNLNAGGVPFEKDVGNTVYSVDWQAYSNEPVNQQILRIAVNRLELLEEFECTLFNIEKGGGISSSGPLAKNLTELSEGEFVIVPAWEQRDVFLLSKFEGHTLGHNNTVEDSETSIQDDNKLLFVSPIQGGGTKVASDDLLSLLKGSGVKIYKMICFSNSLKFYEIIGDDEHLIDHYELSSATSVLEPGNFDYDITVARFCLKTGIAKVYLDHLAWQSLTLQVLLSELGLYSSIELHDFYVICPSYQLINAEGEFCGGLCGTKQSNCESRHLWPAFQTKSLRGDHVYTWRKFADSALSHSNVVFTPDETASELVTSFFTSSTKDKIKVIPHRLGIHPNLYARRQTRSKKPRVLLLGDITPAKGKELVAELLQHGEASDFEFIALGGNWHGRDFQAVEFEGAYERSKVSGAIEKLEVDVALFPHIWPETYSYTVRESLYCGVPVVTSDLGAPGQLVKEFQLGEVLEPNASSKDWLSALRQVSRKDYFSEISRFVEQHELRSRKLQREKVELIMNWNPK